MLYLENVPCSSSGSKRGVIYKAKSFVFEGRFLKGKKDGFEKRKGRKVMLYPGFQKENLEEEREIPRSKIFFMGVVHVFLGLAQQRGVWEDREMDRGKVNMESIEEERNS